MSVLQHLKQAAGPRRFYIRKGRVQQSIAGWAFGLQLGPGDLDEWPSLKGGVIMRAEVDKENNFATFIVKPRASSVPQVSRAEKR